jgi:hypothetical protein
MTNRVFKTKSKNWTPLVDFVSYCLQHPEQRFWQALRNWAGTAYIFVGDHMGSEVIGGRDTFNFRGKNK